ncbi:putative glycerol-3-phosphate transporter 5 [Spatholobus suberectus]|nr:putative glycerol-3-phosphate transporter 5 [Spatholobus suberectus]
MQSKSLSLAPALTLFPGLKPPHKTLLFHQICVLVITFLAYASFHASRKPPSIVKSVLGPTVPSNATQVPNLSSYDAGWPPFNGTQGTHRLGELDLAFLTSYSIGMYLAGHVGDRIDLSCGELARGIKKGLDNGGMEFAYLSGEYHWFSCGFRGFGVWMGLVICGSGTPDHFGRDFGVFVSCCEPGGYGLCASWNGHRNEC